jgi:hypothetical protein
LITESKEKPLQWSVQVKTMDKTRIPRRALELKFKGKSHMG